MILWGIEERVLAREVIDIVCKRAGENSKIMSIIDILRATYRVTQAYIIAYGLVKYGSCAILSDVSHA